MRSPEEVLKFWFVEHGSDDWYAGRPEFDAAISDQFGQTHSHVAKGEAWEWRKNLDGRLAEIIVLDQFSRQLFRGRPEAFAQDKMALALAQEVVALGWDRELPVERRAFVYLPFMHAESVAIQAVSVRLYQGLGAEEQLEYALKHQETIARFGRFPFRNDALGRESTAEETAYMQEQAGRSF